MIVKAILKSFDAGTYTATVQLVGSMASYIEALPVSRAIPAAEMVEGRSCAIVMFSTSNFSDAVLFAVYG